MAGIFWCNDREYGYFGHDIFILPGQMIPEHAHVKTAKGPAKMETWHIRYGSLYVFGEGEETKPCPVNLPASQNENFVTARNCEKLEKGEKVTTRITNYGRIVIKDNAKELVGKQF